MLDFTVVVPAYNEEKYIEDCLKCLQDQEGNVKFEVLVVDNNCTDKSTEIAKKYRARIVKEPVQGMIVAKQRGLLEARGKYVAFADADTRPPKYWLKMASEALNKPNVVGVTGPVSWYGRRPRWYDWYAKFGAEVVEYFYKHWGKMIYVTGNNMIMDRESLLKVGGFGPYLGVGEDEIAAKRLCKVGNFVYEPEMMMVASGRRGTKGFAYFFYELISRYVIGHFLATTLKLKTKFEFVTIR